MIKKSIAILFIGLFVSLFNLGTVTAKVPDTAPVNGIYDEARILDSRFISYIESLNSQLQTTDRKIQVGIVTVESLNNEPIERFALNIARKWQIGYSESNHGLLYVVALKDRQMRLEISDQLSTIFTDGEANLYLEIVKPYYRIQDYSNGTLKLIETIANEKLIPHSKNESVVYHNKQVSHFENFIKFSFTLIFISIFIAIIFKRNGGKPGRGGGENLLFTTSAIFDMLHASNSNNNNNNSSSGWSGGGFSGGGSSGSW